MKRRKTDRGRQRGGSSTPVVSTDPAKHRLVLKSRDKKEVERERQEEREKQKALIDEWGVTEEELQKAGEQKELSRRDAAYNDLAPDELCRDLAVKFARKSARKTEDVIGEVRDRYETIVTEFLVARYAQPDGNRVSLATVLRSKYETDEALGRSLPALRRWLGEYIAAADAEGHDKYNWIISGHAISANLLNALAEEYKRDCNGLMRFLSAVFKHWRKIFAPQSLFSVRQFVHQVVGSSKDIAEAIERAGILSKTTTEEQFNSLRQRTRKIRSRDQRLAIEKKILMELRAAGKRGFTAAEISERTHFSNTVVSDALSKLQCSRKAKWKWWQPNKDEKRQKFWFAR